MKDSNHIINPQLGQLKESMEELSERFEIIKHHQVIMNDEFDDMNENMKKIEQTVLTVMVSFNINLPP